MPEQDDKDKLRWVLDARNVFNQMVISAELEVHREILLSLLAGVSPSPFASITPIQIHKMTAERVNRMLAATADTYPGGVGPFSALLEEWKKMRQI